MQGARASMKKGVGSGAPGGDFGGQFQVEDNRREAPKLVGTEYAPDLELEQGFPDAKTSYQSKPCLEGVEDEYTQADRAKLLKNKLRNGMQDAFGGDADFLQAAAAS
uniref:Uncharacterized protein n=1 Tax=Euplotes crassus TaxID=5936 RepID=A0A7S3KBI5_EUPCR|mmetsp:Transcript_19107/g.18749  ORF Transcript_19107/g.18749 Transcript_19107/m.18749 type:complete len:107 (+) Transcript_19107:82-402(+)